MRERPIIFKSEMVRAILSGRKTQTRRIVKPQPCETTPGGLPIWKEPGGRRTKPKCPYGFPGDLLWVKETYWAFGRWDTYFNADKERGQWHFIDSTRYFGRSYQFEEPAFIGGRGEAAPAWHKRPSIFMPRKASRITLEVVSIRVERLQDISGGDAEKEGALCDGLIAALDANADEGYPIDETICLNDMAINQFRMLWESINGPESWAANPWVWVIEFKVVEP